MTRPTLVVLVLALGAAACNAILGNDPGDLFDAGVDTAVDGTLAVDASGGSVDAAVPIVDAGVDAARGQPCEMGEKICFGQCVSKGDPLYGCALDGCTPCKSIRATSVCAGGACAIGACDPGYADCDRTASDGCETDLSQPAHCGECNAVCPTSAPYCAPSGASFICSTNCPAQAPTLCGTQCVDLNTSESHCGDCNTPCPVVANGQETCVARQCELACDPGFHACGNACASNVDPGTCGASCAPCPSENAIASCNGATCGFACVAGWGDCDKNPTNACETPLSGDPNNCGACGRSCAGNPCVAGQCKAPDAGPPDAGPPDAGSADTGPG